MKPGDLVRIRFPKSEWFEPYEDWNGQTGLLVKRSAAGHPSWFVLVRGVTPEINARYLRRLNATR